MNMHNDALWMKQAIDLAKQAGRDDEVPVGAILVKEGQLISQAYNCPIQSHDPTAHAEIMALREGAKKIKNYRLLNTTLYVTLEPCLMCAAAMVHARIQRLVFGARDPKTGAIVSQLNVLDFSWLNHRVEYQGDVLSNDCAELLKQFFRERRA